MYIAYFKFKIIFFVIIKNYILYFNLLLLYFFIISKEILYFPEPSGPYIIMLVSKNYLILFFI